MTVHPMFGTPVTTNGNRNGTLIALDALDGAGKTTLGTELGNRLTAMGASVTTFVSFITDRSVYYWESYLAIEEGERVGVVPAIISRPCKQLLHAYNMVCLARADLSALLATHDFVLADRYILSRYVLARQETGTRDSDAERLIEGAAATKVIPRPDHTIYLDVEPALALERILARGEPLQPRESLEGLAHTRELFLRTLEEENVRCLLGQIHHLSSTETPVKDLADRIMSRLPQLSGPRPSQIPNTPEVVPNDATRSISA